MRAMVLEQLGYRQHTVYWRLRGLAKALRGDQRWGAQQRKGFTAAVDGHAATQPEPTAAR